MATPKSSSRLIESLLYLREDRRLFSSAVRLVSLFGANSLPYQFFFPYFEEKFQVQPGTHLQELLLELKEEAAKIDRYNTPFQLLVVGSIVLDERRQRSFVGCLRLCSAEVISFDDTSEWLGKLHPSLPAVFDLLRELPPIAFHPKRASSKENTGLLPEWIELTLGSYMYSIIDELSPNQVGDAILMAIDANRSPPVRKVDYLEIAELQFTTYAVLIQKTQKEAKENRSIELPTSVRTKLYGNQKPSEQRFQKHFRELGLEALNNFDRLLAEKMEHFDTVNDEYRYAVHRYNKFHLFKLKLFIKSQAIPRPKQSQKAQEVLTQLFPAFTDLSIISNCLKNSKFYLDELSAKSLWHYIHIQNLCNQTGKSANEILSLLQNAPSTPEKIIVNLDFHIRQFVPFFLKSRGSYAVPLVDLLIDKANENIFTIEPKQDSVIFSMFTNPNSCIQTTM